MNNGQRLPAVSHGSAIWPSLSGPNKLNGMLWAAILFWIVAGIGLLLAECLRAYSRSRLLAECKRRGVESRFRSIMQHDEHAQLLCTAGASLGLVGASVTTATALPSILSVTASPAVLALQVCCWFGVLFVATSIVPWAIGRIAAEWILAASWPVLAFGLVATKPLLLTASATDTVFHRLAGRDDPEADVDAISEEIDAVVDEGERDGIIEEGVSQMIQRVVDLRNVDVRDVMTPRTEIVTLPVDSEIAEAKRCFVDAGHSRIPVIGDSPDDMLGVVYAKDLLQVEETANDAIELQSLLREPLIVPETTPVDQLLERMRQRRMHIAMVLDEYGGVVGLVTLEDILEEIVGDISDEYDPEHDDEEHVRIDERTIEVDARMHVDDLNDKFGYDLPDDGDFETVGGFVFSEMGHVPEKGESIVWKNLEISVLDADRRKIVRLKIHQIDSTSVVGST